MPVFKLFAESTKGTSGWFASLCLSLGLQFAAINLEQVLSIRQQPDVTAALSALAHAGSMFFDLVVGGTQIPKRFLQSLR